MPADLGYAEPQNHRHALSRGGSGGQRSYRNEFIDNLVVALEVRSVVHRFAEFVSNLDG